MFGNPCLVFPYVSFALKLLERCGTCKAGTAVGAGPHCPSCRGAGQQAAMTCYQYLPWQFSKEFRVIPHMTGTKGVPKARLLAGYAFVYAIYMLFDYWPNERCRETCAVWTNEALQTRAKSFRDSICSKMPQWACSVHTSLVNDGAWGHGQHATRSTPRATWNFRSTFCAGVVIVACLYNPNTCMSKCLHLVGITACSRLNVACRTFRMFTN